MAAKNSFFILLQFVPIRTIEMENFATREVKESALIDDEDAFDDNDARNNVDQATMTPHKRLLIYLLTI